MKQKKKKKTKKDKKDELDNLKREVEMVSVLRICSLWDNNGGCDLTGLHIYYPPVGELTLSIS